MRADKNIYVFRSLIFHIEKMMWSLKSTAPTDVYRDYIDGVMAEFIKIQKEIDAQIEA